MIKNLIFDWSGVLSNDLVPVYKAVMNIFRELGLKTLTLEEFRREFVLPYMSFYKKFTNISKEKQDKMFIKEFNSGEEPKAFPKVKKVLEFLNKNGIKLAILSSHPQERIEKQVRDYGLQKFFIDVVGSVHDKIKVITGIVKRNNFIKKETAYVGDMVHDIKVGKKANIFTIAVSWGYQPKEKLSKYNPDFLIDNLNQLKEIVTSNV